MDKKLPPECYRWRGFVIKDDSLPFGAKAIALYLDSFMNDSHDFAFPSLRRIECEMKVARNTVIKYLGCLEEAGYIRKGKILNPATSQYHNTYTALIPEGGSLTAPPKEKVVQSVTEGGSNEGSKVVHDVNPNNQGNNQKNNQGGKNSRFVPPSLDVLRTFVQDNNLNVDPEQFIDFYQSKNWFVGKSKMKDWKASARNWSRRQDKESPRPVVREEIRYDAFGRPRKPNGQGGLL